MANCDLKLSYKGYLIVLLFLTPRIAYPGPLFSTVTIPPLIGNCVSLETSELGTLNIASTRGLVSKGLVTVAMRRDMSSVYHTSQRPLVRIVRAVRTCQSRAIDESWFNTASFLVSYTCSGIACEQLPDDVRTLSYVHLFSFVCQNGSNVYTTWDYVTGYDIHINRTTTNSVSNLVTTLDGSCVLCTNDPALDVNPRFDPITGCVGMFKDAIC